MDFSKEHFGVKLPESFDFSKSMAGFDLDLAGGDEEIWVADKAFEVETDKGTINLRVGLVSSNFKEMTGETLENGHDFVVSVILLPDIDTMTEERVEDYRKGCSLGIGEILTYYDLYLYGSSVTAHEESCMGTESDDLLKYASGLRDCVEGMVGFILDRPVTRAGTTGWDCAERWLTGDRTIAVRA